MSILWTVLGLLFLSLAVLAATRLESATVGEYSSRFIAIALALAAYFGLTFAAGTLNPVKLGLLRYLVPILGVGTLVFYAVKIYQNRQKELATIIKVNGAKVVIIVLFAVAARFFLSL